jgi:tRNA 5-methylaminomethyl-2-thiouridine biosynthesis bifunctional protein
VQFISATQASELAGVPIDYSALYFPNAGWIYPRALCEHWVKHPSIRVMTQTAAIEMNRTHENWQITTHNSTLIAPVVIIANARDAAGFSLTQHLPIKAIRGQTTYLPQSQSSQHLKTVICSDGYISPAHNGMHCTGATFTLKDESTAVRSTDHHTNLKNLREFTPELAVGWETLNLDSVEGRVAFRCSLPDYLPVVGAAPIEEMMLSDFAPLRKNSRAGIPTAGSYWPGLYINLGHGSRGLAYTPICAELLAAQINHEILPTPQDMANALNPARFLIRDLIKNKR